MIHEAFKGFEVRFYLVVIVEGEPDVLVVFPVSSLVVCTRSRLIEPISSIYFQNEKSLKKSGEVLGIVYTMQNHDTSNTWESHAINQCYLMLDLAK